MCSRIRRTTLRSSILSPMAAPLRLDACDYHTFTLRPETTLADQPSASIASRPLPAPTPETKHFWEGTRSGELRLQRCAACEKAYFPPRPFCPRCGSRDVAVFKASGKGTLHSYVIHQRPTPGFTPPYSIAVVEL